MYCGFLIVRWIPVIVGSVGTGDIYVQLNTNFYQVVNRLAKPWKHVLTKVFHIPQNLVPTNKKINPPYF